MEPDTKDWTWTLERACAECGFDASRVQAAQLAGQVRELTAPWPTRLADPDVAQRPAAGTWSPLEYGCHIHEVLEIFRQRFELIAAEDNPTLPNWDQDAAALEHGYASADPAQIAAQIPDRTEALTRSLTGLQGAWDRPAQRSDGAAFTALTLARYLTHDLAHHLHDVGVEVRND